MTAINHKRILAALAATLAVGLLAEAAFPGQNGRLAFASDRTAGPGVDNPEGELEIFITNPDGTGLKQLTRNSAVDTHAA